ncbi:MAG TPA: hypothetical protein VF723_00700 [Pyrinomonadaceae bacterium]|jgi:hypothetical protein
MRIKQLVQRYFVFGAALLALSLAALVAPSGPALAQQQGTPTGSAQPAEIDRIIRSFTAKEIEFRQALNQYAFKRDAVFQTIGMGGQISGEYHRISFFTFDDSGNRFEKINFFPMPTLQELVINASDLEDLGGVQQFALEPAKIDQYNFTYVGKERIDELNLHIFDVTPKVMPNPKKSKERFFQGRIWVDDQDLQIVKVRGKGVPETKEDKHPVFETYREQIDGRYWFPTYSYADEDLVFGNGNVVHIRVRVRYSDFKKGRADVKITEVNGDEVEDAPQPQPSPSPVKKP